MSEELKSYAEISYYAVRDYNATHRPEKYPGCADFIFELAHPIEQEQHRQIAAAVRAASAGPPVGSILH